VPLHTELRRVLPVIERLTRESFPAILSIDTCKAPVAEAALQRGAGIINDISACRDPEMAPTAARHNAGLVLMHMRGTPGTMQQGDLNYDAIAEVTRTLTQASEAAILQGVKPDRIFLDPGIGFGKTLGQNIELTQRLGELGRLGFPLVYGPSRKRFLGEITSRDISDRDRATAAACAIAVGTGAHIFRVHNPEAVTDALALAARFRDLS
jgi:dihydropteroate synthase